MSENYIPGAIVWHYLRDPTFSRFDTIWECDRHTDRHTTTAYTAISIASVIHAVCLARLEIRFDVVRPIRRRLVTVLSAS